MNPEFYFLHVHDSTGPQPDPHGFPGDDDASLPPCIALIEEP